LSAQGISAEPRHTTVELMTAFIAATEALICIVDGAGRILFANPAVQRFTGRGAQDLIGRDFCTVYVVPEHVALARDAIETSMATGVAAPQEADWLTGDGERRRVAMRNTVLRDDAGRPYAVGCVGVDVTDDRRREAQLHRRAQTDLLTGLANRGALFDALRTRLQSGPGCALLFCDLDDFKMVNDEHGHAVGDQLLVEVAIRLSRLTDPEDVVARFGGDEFVILSPHRGEPELTRLAEGIVASVSAPFSGPSGPLHVGVSVGMAVGRPGESADDVISRADHAMYGAKTLQRRRRVR
jgi:diguanylate cyclase (GGDEF)-like protein/PAS domain S-box-containing protein